MSEIDERRLLERMRIPPLFQDCSIDQIPDGCPHKEIVVKFIEDLSDHLKEGFGLLLHGENSMGKSALSTLILRNLPVGEWGLWIESKKIPQYIIEKTMFDDLLLYTERMQSVDLLVLDELILHQDDTFRDTSIELVFRERVLNMKSTIFTSNASPDQIKNLYPSLYEVMKEVVLPVLVSGHDFRADRSKKMEETILK